MTTTPRYYVREHSGYPSPVVGSTARRMLTEVRVVDRAYCHCDVKVYRIPTRGIGRGNTTAGNLAKRRTQADALCAELNALEEANS